MWEVLVASNSEIYLLLLKTVYWLGISHILTLPCVDQFIYILTTTAWSDTVRGWIRSTGRCRTWVSATLIYPNPLHFHKNQPCDSCTTSNLDIGNTITLSDFSDVSGMLVFKYYVLSTQFEQNCHICKLYGIVIWLPKSIIGQHSDASGALNWYRLIGPFVIAMTLHSTYRHLGKCSYTSNATHLLHLAVGL